MFLSDDLHMIEGPISLGAIMLSDSLLEASEGVDIAALPRPSICRRVMLNLMCSDVSCNKLCSKLFCDCLVINRISPWDSSTSVICALGLIIDLNLSVLVAPNDRVDIIEPGEMDFSLSEWNGMPCCPFKYLVIIALLNLRLGYWDCRRSRIDLRYGLSVSGLVLCRPPLYA